MTSHFFKLVFVALMRFKSHAAINLISLIFGFCCFMAAILASEYINSFDKHFPNADKTYVLTQTIETQGSVMGLANWVVSAEPIAAFLHLEYPQLKQVSKSRLAGGLSARIDGKSDVLNGRYIDPGFLQIFPLEISNGIETGADIPPNSALITEQAALAKFGSTDVVGRRFLLADEIEITIVGTLAAADKPSHIVSDLTMFSSELLVPMSVNERLNTITRNQLGLGPQTDNWLGPNYYTYIQLPEDGSISEQQLQEMLDRFVEDVVPKRSGYSVSYSFKRINEMTSSLLDSFTLGINITSVLSFVGFLVLLIAALNYANLNVAQLSLRSQEIGIQKILGATRSALVIQYSLESLLFTLVALTISCGFILYALSSLGDSGLIGINGALLLSPELWFDLGLVLFLITAIAGSYPGIRSIMSPPTNLLRPRGSGGYSGKLRGSVVGLQFLVSGILLIFSLVVFKQNEVMTQQLDGLNTDPKLAITVPLHTIEADPEALIRQLSQHPGVEGATRTSRVPWDFGVSDISLSNSSDPNSTKFSANTTYVGFDYFQTLESTPELGRPFSRDRASDSYPANEEDAEFGGPYSIVIDSSLAESLGWETPDEALGKTIYQHLQPPRLPSAAVVEHTIIGISDRQKFGIIDWKIAGMAGLATLQQPSQSSYLVLRLSRSNLAQTLRHIDDTWARLVPEIPIARQFTDDLFNSSLYQVFVVMNSTITFLAILAFLIASIGLLGNATFIVNIRQREVGIRKVMGASTARLIRMLLMDFSKPVIIANAIAWPIAYQLSSYYISVFATPANIGLSPFIICLLLSVLVSVVGVFAQSYSSAKMRPAEILRYE